MAKTAKKNKISFIKKKAGPQLGYRTSDHFKSKKFSGFKKGQRKGFNTSQFRTQHRG